MKSLMKYILLFLPIMANFGFIDYANAKSKPEPVITLATPYNTIYIHLRYLQEDLNNPAKASLALYKQDTAKAEIWDKAEKLKRILDFYRYAINLEEAPRDSNYIDEVTGKSVFYLLENNPRVYVEKYSGKWYYSAETVESIEQLYSEIFKYDPENIESMLPSFALEKFFGIELWKYIAFIAIYLAGYLFYKIFSWIFSFVLIRVFAKIRRKEIALNYIKPLAKPLSLLLTVVLVRATHPYLFLPQGVSIAVEYAFLVLIPLIVVIISYRLADLVGDILSKLAQRTKSTVDDNLIPFLRKGLKVVIIIFGALYILQNLNVNITPLLAGVSIGGLAIALAAQETVKNLFGSFTIFSDQPFEVGDWIVFDGIEGTVEEVGVRSTRVRTFYSSLVSIPNGKLADMTIDNMGRRKYRRYMTKLCILYSTPIDTIEKFVEELNLLVAEHPKTLKDNYRIAFSDFADSSLNIIFNIFFDVNDWAEELKARHEINIQIMQIAKRLGVDFAFPTRTIHIEGSMD